MGPKFTEGAVVQHLSKLRIKREEQDKPNPPPLKRAGNGTYKKEATSKEPLPTQKEVSKSQARGTKRRRESDEYSSEDVYTLKKKYADNLKNKKVPFSTDNRVKHEDAESDNSPNLVCAGAPWLQDFRGRQGVDENSGDSIKESPVSSTDISQATSDDSKKSKIVKLKMTPERLADIDRQIGALMPLDQTMPMNMQYAHANLAPSPTVYYPYMYPVPPMAYSPFSPSSYAGTSNSTVPIPYPSNGPSPFDYRNRSGTLTNEPAYEVKNDETTGEDFGATGWNFATFPGFDMRGEFQNQPDSGNIPASYASNELNNQFPPEANELFVPPSEFADMGEVQGARYYGYEGEDTKEF